MCYIILFKKIPIFYLYVITLKRIEFAYWNTVCVLIFLLWRFKGVLKNVLNSHLFYSKHQYPSHPVQSQTHQSFPQHPFPLPQLPHHLPLHPPPHGHWPPMGNNFISKTEWWAPALKYVLIGQEDCQSYHLWLLIGRF